MMYIYRGIAPWMREQHKRQEDVKRVSSLPITLPSVIGSLSLSNIGIPRVPFGSRRNRV